MRSEHCVPVSISFRPAVLRALRHYVRTKAVNTNGTIPRKFGFSTVANEILERGLAQRGFNPRTLRLIGERG